MADGHADPRRLEDLAASILDGTDVDWAALESDAPHADRGLIRQLRLVSAVAAVHRSAATPRRAGARLLDLPARWGPLDVLEHIGRGSCGDVYRAWDRQLDREVALKLLPGSAPAADSTSDVVEEGRLLARVRHPNVVTVHGAARIDGHIGIWMEYVRGRTLEQELASRGRFSPAGVLSIGRDLCDALTAVHEAGLLHRDIKAHNVMVDGPGRVVLMDFGTGREQFADGEAASDLTGTPLYLAPEVLEHQPATPRSDVYSLSVLLYHLLTGTYPVMGGTAAEIRQNHRGGALAPLGRRRADVPARLERVIARGLSADPRHRYASAADMGAALVMPASRQPLMYAAAASLLVAVVSAGFWTAARRGSSAASIPQRAAPSGDRAVWTGPEVDGFGGISRDGRFLTWTDWNDNAVMLRDLIAGTDRRLTPPPSDNAVVEFSTISKFGNEVAFERWKKGERGELRVASLLGTGIPPSRVLLSTADITSIHPFDWSMDGQWIAAAIARTTGVVDVALVGAHDGHVRVLRSLKGMNVGKIFFSPDDRFVAYDLQRRGDRERSILIAAVDASGELEAVHDGGMNNVMGWSPDGRQLLFASDRTGSASLWALPVADGRPAGAPVEALPDIDSFWSLGTNATGTVYVWKSASAQVVQVASIDLNSGTLGPIQDGGIQRFVESRGRVDWSPDGKSLAFTSCGLLGGDPCTLYVRSLDTGRTRELHPGRYIWFPRWSPDGRTFVVRVGGGPANRVYLIDAETGTLSDVITPKGDQPDWLPDGRTIVFKRESGIFERHLGSGMERHIPLESPGGIGEFALAPDGRLIAFTSRDEHALLVALRTGGRPRTLLQVGDDSLVRPTWTPDGTAILVARHSSPRRDLQELWLVPVVGAPPRRMNIDISKWNLDGGFRVSPDGRRIAFVAAAGNTGSEIRALDSFLPVLHRTDATSGLAATGASATPPSTSLNKVWSGPRADPDGTISADGRRLSYTDWDTGDLALHDFLTNTDRRLTNKGTWKQSNEYALQSTISHDGTQVAYAWSDTNGHFELRIISVGAAGAPRRLFYDHEMDIAPYDWSPDGQRIAVQLLRSDHTGQIGWVDVDHGSLHVLKSVDWRGSTKLVFSPDGKYLAFDVPTDESARERDVYLMSVDGSRQWPVVVSPGLDQVVGWSPDGSRLLFASNRSGTLGLWAVRVSNGRPEGAAEMVVPDIGPAALGVDARGRLFMGRPTGGMDVYTASIDAGAGTVLVPPARAAEAFLGFNRMPDWSPDGKTLAFVSSRNIFDPDPSRNPVIVLRSSDTGRVVREVQPKLMYMLAPHWSVDGRALYAYGLDLKSRRGIVRIDAATGDVTFVVKFGADEGGTGPMSLPDGRSIVYRRGTASTPDLGDFVQHDLSSGAERTIIRREGITLPSPSPDGHQIATVINDVKTKSSSVVVLSIHGGALRELARVPFPQSFGSIVSWTRDGRYLLTTKLLADDGNGSELWEIPVAGGAPRKIDIGLPPPLRPMIAVHPDGHRIAMVAGQNQWELWRVDGLLPQTRTDTGTATR